LATKKEFAGTTKTVHTELLKVMSVHIQAHISVANTKRDQWRNKNELHKISGKYSTTRI
jgi:hypothetical protein